VEGEQVPIIPVHGTYNLQYNVDEIGRIQFSAENKDPSISSEIQVLSGFGYDPNHDGELSSIIAACTPNCVFVQSLHDELLTAEFLKNNPVLYCESQQTNISDKEGIAYDFYADAQNYKREPESAYNRSRKDILQLTHQKKAYTNALSHLRTRKGKTSAQAFAEKNAEGALSRLVPLPPGQKMVRQSNASTRSDFINILNSKQSEIAASFGLPRSMVMNDGSKAKGDESGQHSTFRSTVIYWQNLLGKMMTNVHSFINSHQHSDALKKIQKRKVSTTKKDLYRLKEKECVIIHFPINIYGTSNEELKSLYEEEIIDRKTYAEYRLKNAGLPIDLLFRVDDPLTSEQKKNQYLQAVPIATSSSNEKAIKRKAIISTEDDREISKKRNLN
jgi:hypothetical protein